MALPHTGLSFVWGSSSRDIYAYGHHPMSSGGTAVDLLPYPCIDGENPASLAAVTGEVKPTPAVPVGRLTSLHAIRDNRLGDCPVEQSK